MEHWDFDDLFFFGGNVSLRNKAFPKFSITLLFENRNDIIDPDVSLYGALQFKRVVWRARPFNPAWNTAKTQLVVQELRSKLPPDLTAMCPTSAHLSDIDVKLNEYALNAMSVLEEIRALCDRRNAALKMEDG